MSKKVLWFDCETTGLNPIKNDIIQLAAMIEVEGKIVAEFNSKCAPFDATNVDAKALVVNNLKLEDVLKYPNPRQVQKEFVIFLSRYVDKYNKSDKYAPAGYNVGFDIDFLSSFFKKAGDSYYGSFFNYKSIDPLRLVHIMDYKRQLDLPNYKLTTVCEHYGIKFEAHEALADIKATRDLFNLLWSGINLNHNER